ncbi:MAG TPA: nuclear transport factor 2 family protein [Candidatus Binataceae bacterium]|nr:nuclear transport factor 2 family protein [Candidatus Binataceae bacterium]
MDVAELASKIRLLEDIEAIKTLKYQYCAYCDDSYNADGIAGLFVEDGTWDGGDFGRCEGRQAIRKFFRHSSKILSLAAHQVMNPIIKVDGDHATGEWKLCQPCTLETKSGARAMWLVANYRDEYVRTPAGWKFKSLKVTSLFFAPHDEGWAKTRFFKA